MKVVIAVDSFKGSLTAVQACEIIRNAFLGQNSSLEVVSKPLAGGGEGTASIVLSATDSRWSSCGIAHTSFISPHWPE
ncbi:MAG: glycerate kinase [Sedimentisphaerales bacterium]